MKEKYPFEYKTPEELAKEADAMLEAYRRGEINPMTEEEMIEDDAEYGYFQQEEADW